jgi:hypothetical protein
MNRARPTQLSSMQPSKFKGLHILLRELSDDEDAAMEVTPNFPNDPQRPWLRDYQAYINAVEQVPDGWTTIQWWGVSTIYCIYFIPC